MQDPHRRLLLQAALGGLGVAALPAAAQTLSPTARQAEGPFYPLQLPLDQDNDLVQVSGQARLARGEITHLTGRVMDTSGRALAGARIEIWQCDANGTYHHPDDSGKRDPGFQGFGHTTTAVDGSYRFRTIRPMPYVGRTPHIHYRIRTGNGGRGLSTQLYVKGDQRNAEDFLFRSLDAAQAAHLQAAFEPYEGADASLIARFDPVLPA